MSQDRRPPRLPDGVRVYAIGDIHGYLDLLLEVVDAIEADLSRRRTERAVTVFLGDYVDRGPDSRGVVEYLRSTPIDGAERVCLKGNHEDWFLKARYGSEQESAWLTYGGMQTLASYGAPPDALAGWRVEPGAQELLQRLVPESHVTFLEALPLMHLIGDYCFVHAGVRPGVPLDEQDPDDLIWIRDEFLYASRASDYYVVHGHTPVRKPEILEHRANIDTGVFQSGNLTCLVLEADEKVLLRDL